MKALLACALALLLALLLLATTATADDPTPAPASGTPTALPRISQVTPETSAYMTVKFAAESLGRTNVNGESQAASIGSLTAVVNKRVCTTVDLTGAANTDGQGNKVMMVGLPEQPRECHRDGATVMFVAKQGFRQFVDLTFHPGTSQLVNNLAPQPPGSSQFGFVTLTLTIDGVRKAASGETIGEGPFIMVLPASVVSGRMPISAVIPYVYPLETDGRLPLAIEAGEYFVGTGAIDLQIEGAGDRLDLTSSTDISVPVIRIRIASGERRSVDIKATHVAANPLAPALSPPNVGEVGLK